MMYGCRQAGESYPPFSQWRHLVSLILVWLAGVSRVADATMSEMFYYHSSCSDDVTFVRSLASDCSKYVMCTAGYALAFSCPRGYIFSDFSLRCQLPSPYDKQRCSRLQLANMPLKCLEYPKARVSSYVSCAQYLDCNDEGPSNGPPSYVTECPYPELFSAETGKCEPFHKVRCVGRREPKAPCDYLQYQQLCEGPKCPPCESRHPSCVGKYDGMHAVEKSTTLYIVCLAERTINIGRCTDGFKFSESRKACIPIATESPHSSALNHLAALLSKIRLSLAGEGASKE